MSPMSRNQLSSRLRRELIRYHFHVDAKIVWPSRTRWGRVTNISHSGMFIEIVDPPDLNACFSVYLALDVPLRVDCVVRRVVPRRGVGVTLFVPEHGKTRFEALLMALARGSEPNEAGLNVPRPEQPNAMAGAASAGSH
jgi:PilZ domain